MALPDYPSLKKDISSYLFQFFEIASQKRLGPFDRSPRISYHEGDTSDFSTVDGEVREMNMETYAIEQQIAISELPKMTHEDILRTVIEMGSEFGDKMARDMWRTLGEAISATGNAVNSEGRPLSADLLLDVFEKIEIAFDDDGAVSLPDIAMASGDKVEEIRRITSEPEFQQRLGRLVDRRREEWLARESDRKLVD